MDLTYFKGDYLELELNNGEVFAGWFHSQNKEKTSITLCNIRLLPKGEIIEGVYNYFIGEVKNVRRIDELVDEKLVKKFNVMRVTNEEIENLAVISKKFIFINQMDNDYKLAIEDIKYYSYIAVGTEGSEMGRNCRLPLLTISTPNQIYIFDIQIMQKNAFVDGLKYILESDEIKKIIHNCKKLSDCLFHKHFIKLTNVFDTQIADSIIHKNKYGYFPEKFKTLHECLTTYLGLKEVVPEKIDIVEWSKRPVTVDIKETASLNIVYLHKLSVVLQEELMAPFTRGVEYFLDHLRHSSEYDAWQMNRQDKQLTEEFKNIVGHSAETDECKNKD